MMRRLGWVSVVVACWVLASCAGSGGGTNLGTVPLEMMRPPAQKVVTQR